MRKRREVGGFFTAEDAERAEKVKGLNTEYTEDHRERRELLGLLIFVSRRSLRPRR